MGPYKYLVMNCGVSIHLKFSHTVNLCLTIFTLLGPCESHHIVNNLRWNLAFFPIPKTHTFHVVLSKIQLTLEQHGFEVHRSSNTPMFLSKYTVGPPHSQVLHLWIQPTSDRKQFFWFVVGKPQRWRADCKPYSTPFSIRDLSVCGFRFAWRSWNQSWLYPRDNCS